MEVGRRLPLVQGRGSGTMTGWKAARPRDCPPPDTCLLQLRRLKTSPIPSIKHSRAGGDPRRDKDLLTK